ncbi:hypothetical protein [Escherichia coli]
MSIFRIHLDGNKKAVMTPTY